jgi:hypothetical protein
MLSTSQRNTFKGKDFVNWVVKTKHLGESVMFFYQTYRVRVKGGKCIACSTKYDCLRT